MGRRRANRSKSTPEPYRVFLSHGTHDKWIATILCEKLDAIGARTFRDDRDIQGGDSIPESIRQHIRACDELIVLLTPESITRQWILIEIGIAYGSERRIVPLLYHIEGAQIPEIIRANRGFHLNELEQYLEQLAQRMTKP